MLPLAPHAGGPLPGWQVPLLAEEQHPLVHGALVLQAVPHRCATGSQTSFAGQPALPWQPHAVTPPVVTQSDPAGFPPQLTHSG